MDDGKENGMTPEKIAALQRGIGVFRNIAERLEVGENKSHFEESLSHLSRLLPALDLIKGNPDMDDFARVNEDGSVEVVNFYHEDEDEGGDYADWYKLHLREDGDYGGYYMRFSHENRLGESFDAQIGEVIVNPPFEETQEGKVFGNFQIKEDLKLWTFEEDGTIFYEDLVDGTKGNVDVAESPIGVFKTDPQTLTAQ